MAQPPSLQIAIVGAGVAGLGTAIGLKKHPGIDVQIYERAKEMREIGASIALGPNGMRTLERLGVHNALDESVAFRNKSGFPMIYKHYKTNETVSVDEHRNPVDCRHLTSRFYRAHLQQALLQHVDPARLHLSKTFQSVVFDEGIQKLVLTFTDGSTATADLVISADGIHSPIRTSYFPESRPRWTGVSEACHIWGPDRTLFVSRLGGDLFTVVGSHQADPSAPDAPYRDAVWDSDGDVDVLREFYRDWSPLVRNIIDAVPHTRVYPNTAAGAIDTLILGGGKVTLVGDAAHAHGGAFAAGGSLALDDAWALTSAILHVFPLTATRPPSDAELASALSVYERTRKAHTDKVLQVVHGLNKNKGYRVGKAETDEELRARMRSRGDTSWMHEHDVQKELQRALAEEYGSGGGRLNEEAHL